MSNLLSGGFHVFVVFKEKIVIFTEEGHHFVAYLWGRSRRLLLLPPRHDKGEFLMKTLDRGASVHTKPITVLTGVPTYGYNPTRDDLKISADVEDKVIRQQADGFDGLERVFALIPEERNGEVQWHRQDLAYQRTEQQRSGYYAQNEHTVDKHEARLVDVDREAIKKHGIKMGMETNVGTLWLQHSLISEE